jgi:hypothetical protein
MNSLGPTGLNPGGFLYGAAGPMARTPVRKQQQITNENFLCLFLNRLPQLSGAV